MADISDDHRRRRRHIMRLVRERIVRDQRVIDNYFKTISTREKKIIACLRAYNKLNLRNIKKRQYELFVGIVRISRTRTLNYLPNLI